MGIAQKETCRFLETDRLDRLMDTFAKLLLKKADHMKFTHTKKGAQFIECDRNIDMTIDIKHDVVRDLGAHLDGLFFHKGYHSILDNKLSNIKQ